MNARGSSLCHKLLCRQLVVCDTHHCLHFQPHDFPVLFRRKPPKLPRAAYFLHAIMCTGLGRDMLDGNGVVAKVTLKTHQAELN
jgi:hypothetical protein